MLFSRFWYLFLAVTATVCAGAALLAQGIINERSDAALEAALLRDRAALDVQLVLEARSRLDRLAFVSVDDAFGALLRQARTIKTEDKRLRNVGMETKTALQSQVVKLEGAGHKAPDIAFAVDTAGRVIAQLGPLSANPPGSSLDSYPLVQRALQGYVRDDVWLYDRKVYRMAARPVIQGQHYVGAIVHGYRFTPKFAAALSKGLQGASVAFFSGTRLVAGHVPENSEAPAQPDLATALPAIVKMPILATDGRTSVVNVGNNGRAVFSLLPGSTWKVGVGYAVARHYDFLESPIAIFEQASQQELESLPLPYMGAGLLFAALLGLLGIYYERDRPLKKLRAAAEAIGDGTQDRYIITDFSGPLRQLTDFMNQALDQNAQRTASALPPSSKKANLDELLGPTDEANKDQPFFGFATDNDKPASPQPQLPPAQFQFRDAPSEPQAPPSRPSPVPRPPVAQPAPAPAAPAPAAVPAPAPAAPAPAVPAPAAPAPAAPAPAAPAPEAGHQADVSAEAEHFREVYTNYVETRKQCGESVESITFAKFEGTLIKTRDQIVVKHKARSVRFTVYVKAGKAALKASPIR